MTTIAELSARLTSLRASSAAMIAGFEAERWTDADMRAPSLLPDWTRGHVLTHIARHADGMTSAVSGALRGEIVKRYPGGVPERNAGIEAGAARPVTEQLADVRESAARLDRVLGAVADIGGWELIADDRAVGIHLGGRWREIEIHRVDSAGAYTPDHWPAEFIDWLLPTIVDGLARLTDAPLRVEIIADGSLTVDLPGSFWTVGAGEPTVVAGPDWAVLAWLAGRPTLAAAALTAVPEISNPW